LLSGRTQDPGTTILQLRLPVEVLPRLKISIVRDPSNVLLELVESARE
jgi:hypothetical protein